MKCENCPVAAERGVCLGETIPRLCILARTRGDYRLQLIRLAREAALRPGMRARDLQEILTEVSNCPHRGALLPLPLQPECGCSELTECRVGRGAHPGRVTLHDCLACLTYKRDREA